MTSPSYPWEIVDMVTSISKPVGVDEGVPHNPDHRAVRAADIMDMTNPLTLLNDEVRVPFLDPFIAHEMFRGGDGKPQLRVAGMNPRFESLFVDGRVYPGLSHGATVVQYRTTRRAVPRAIVRGLMGRSTEAVTATLPFDVLVSMCMAYDQTESEQAFFPGIKDPNKRFLYYVPNPVCPAHLEEVWVWHTSEGVHFSSTDAGAITSKEIEQHDRRAVQDLREPGHIVYGPMWVS